MMDEYLTERRGAPDPFVRDLERVLATKRLRRGGGLRSAMSAAAALFLVAAALLIDRDSEDAPVEERRPTFAPVTVDEEPPSMTTPVEEGNAPVTPPKPAIVREEVVEPRDPPGAAESELAAPDQR